MVQTAAIADGVTTLIGLNNGAVESNKLIGGAPSSIVLITALKFGIGKMTESLPEPQQRSAQRVLSGVWCGASVNNVLIILGASGVAPIAAGIATGYYIWKTSENNPVGPHTGYKFPPLSLVSPSE